MGFVSDIIEQVRVSPNKKFKLKDHNPGWDGDDSLSVEERKAWAEERREKAVKRLESAQEKLYASDTWSLLLIFQAMDAAGKDGTIKHVMSGINPQGCQVYSFKHPSAEELDHNFLWRCSKVVPERGRIGIFNRSYYEEVLIVKVHPEYVKSQRIPDTKLNDKFWQGRYEDINNFEEHLSRNGTVIRKFFLNISKDEQRRRFLSRLNEPSKNWKFAIGDMKERGYWDQYMECYEEAIAATSTKRAPWYIIPADHKWVCRTLVAEIIAQTVEELDLQFPVISEEQRRAIMEYKSKLEGEEES